MLPLRFQALTAAQQMLSLKHGSVSRGQGSLRRGLLTWEFIAQPTPLSREYRIRIRFQQGDVPEVHVLSPDLNALADGRRLPHVYEQKPPRLCLYLPREREWTSTMKIADTIVPWTHLWLFYFEQWLVSNEWQGGGRHPEISSAKLKKYSLHRRRRH